MFRPAVALALFLACTHPMSAQTETPLWPTAAPGALGTAPEDIPTLTAFPADPGRATGVGIVVCPGGGYVKLAPHEGEGYARWLNGLGISAYVLKYRLGPKYHHPVMIEDAARALRTVRAHAAEWKLGPHRIGIMGSSAGGHLASTLMTHFDAGKPGAEDPIEREGSRPDFGILCYAVIDMEGPWVNKGSRDHLLGPDPAPELLASLSNASQVTKDTPPCFIWSTGEDTSVDPQNLLGFASALQKAGVAYDAHIYRKGKHGIGLGGVPPEKLHPWTDDCVYWMRAMDILRP